MSREHEMIVVDVPPGFKPMSKPVDPALRLTEDEIALSRAEDKDLLDIADSLHEGFPEIWWSVHEPPSIRAPPDVRRERLAKRFAPTLRHPLIHTIKASLRSTGEFVGFACWFAPSDDIYDALGGKHVGLWRYDANKDAPQGLGFAKIMGWSEAEVKDTWAAVDLKTWEAEVGGYDRVRTEEMGATPHWYLGPIVVVDKFRGRGVGKMLLEYAAELADAQDPPTPLYLESMPSARPVYLHCGYVPLEGPGRELVLVRNMPKPRPDNPS